MRFIIIIRAGLISLSTQSHSHLHNDHFRVVRQEPLVQYKNGSVSTPSKRHLSEHSLLREGMEGASYYTEFFDVMPSGTYHFKQRPSLYRVLWKQFRGSMILCIVQKILSDVALLLSPPILG